MATKKVKKSKKTKKQTGLVKVSPERRMAWGGVIPQSNSSQEIAVVAFCNQVAQIYGVPSLGVNAMGDKPYLNKDGRLYLLNELRRGKSAIKAIRTEFIQLSTGLDVPAIVKKILIFKDGVEVEAIGEASKDNIKLDAVKKTLNMMAETRAMNRAIWQAIGADVWNRVAENLAKAKDMTPIVKAKIVEAGKVSYEEMESPSQRFPTGTPEEILIRTLNEKVDSAKTVEELMDYSDKLINGKSSKSIKDAVSKHIKERVDELTK